MDESSKRAPEAERRALWKALGLAWEFGYLIVVPLVFFSLAGLWLDRRFETSPWLFLSGMALAVSATTILLVRKFSQILRDIDDASKPSSGKTS